VKLLLTLAETVFEWTWKTSLSATLLIVLVFLLQKILARWLTPRLRYTLSLLALIRLLLPMAPSSPLSFENLIPSQARKPIPPISDLSAVEVTSISRVHLSPLSPPATSRPWRLTLSEVSCIIWALGCLCLLSLAGWRFGKWNRLMQQGCRISNPRLLELLDNSRKAMGVRGSVALVAVARMDSPAVFGFWKFRLLLPQIVLERLDDEELRMIFLHEMAHVRRKDVPLNFLLMAVQFLHWFNPLVWLSFHWLRADRELVCDAMVMRRMKSEERLAYGKVLLKLMGDFSSGTSVFSGAVPVVSSKDEITRRIQMIKNHRHAGIAVCAATALSVVALAFSAFTQAPRPAQEPVAPDSAVAKKNDQAELTWKAIADLKKQLNSINPDDRKNALMSFWSSSITLTEAENPAIGEALPALVQATRDEVGIVRWFAAQTLWKIKSSNRDVVMALGHLAAIDTNLNAATIGATALKATGPAAAPAVPDLIRALESRNDDGSFISATDGQLDPDTGTTMGTALRRAALETLGNIGPAAQDAIPVLRKFLNATGEFSLGNRVFSAKALWQITGKADETLPVLINALKNEDSFYAADILGTMGPAAKPAIPTLQSALQSRERYTRLRAVIALHNLDPEFQLPWLLLMDLLKDEDASARLAAAETIWTLNHDSQMILPTLLELIRPHHKSADVPGRYYGDYYGPIRLLGEIGPPAKAAVPRLKEIIREDRFQTVTHFATEALKKIEADGADKGLKL
jgi:beta-lactamase regulating signal transducer with metallopeptidase domain